MGCPANCWRVTDIVGMVAFGLLRHDLCGLGTHFSRRELAGGQGLTEARTTRLLCSSSAVAGPAPSFCASAAMAPSRDSTGLLVSRSTLPANSARKSVPNAAAWRGVPAWAPALTQARARAPPMRPVPMMPIFRGVSGAAACAAGFS
jgi:hypothetical protein